MSFSDTSSNPPDLLDVSGSNFATTARPSSRNDPASVRSQEMSANLRPDAISEAGCGGLDGVAGGGSPHGAYVDHMPSSSFLPRSAATLEDGNYHLANALSDPHD